MGARRALNVAYAALIEGATWEQREEFDADLAKSFDELEAEEQADRRMVLDMAEGLGGEVG